MSQLLSSSLSSFESILLRARVDALTLVNLRALAVPAGRVPIVVAPDHGMRERALLLAPHVDASWQRLL